MDYRKRMNTTIDLTLKDKEDYQSTFNENMLSNELATYIVDECIGVPIDNFITLNIDTKFKISSKEEDKIEEMIHSYFKSMVKEEEILFRASTLWKTVFFIIGIILVLIGYFFHVNKIAFISDLVNILAWVFVWEAAYNYFFENIEKKMRIKKYRNLANCRIVFEKKGTK